MMLASTILAGIALLLACNVAILLAVDHQRSLAGRT